MKPLPFQVDLEAQGRKETRVHQDLPVSQGLLEQPVNSDSLVSQAPQASFLFKTCLFEQTTPFVGVGERKWFGSFKMEYFKTHPQPFIECENLVGRTGSPGPAGFRGAPGGPGFAGPQGGTGPAGNRGLPGGPGFLGPPGATGAPGNAGPSGFPGGPGTPGGVGPQGATGEAKRCP